MKNKIEHMPWIEVWSTSAESARAFFFGPNSDALVVVLKDGPTTERERERYLPTAKLFGVRNRSCDCSCKGCRRHLAVVP